METRKSFTRTKQQIEFGAERWETMIKMPQLELVKLMQMGARVRDEKLLKLKVLCWVITGWN